MPARLVLLCHKRATVLWLLAHHTDTEPRGRRAFCDTVVLGGQSVSRECLYHGLVGYRESNGKILGDPAGGVERRL